MSNSSTDPDLTKRRITASALAVIALLAVLAFTWWIDGQGGPDDSAPAASSSTASAPLSGKSADGSSTSASSTGKRSGTQKAPARVLSTLDKIDSGRWPEAAHAPGTHGGDVFRNREGNLPSKSASGRRITYKEWDVNPKKRGRGRDAERIVTGSDGSAWYTLDHYKTFTQIRGPSA